jgi:predicted metalloprotease with PDZ domain
MVCAATIASQGEAQTALRTYSDAFEARFNRAQPVMQYTVRALPPSDSLGYEVELRVSNVHDTLRVASPVWAPGAYRVANFYRYIANVRISDSSGVVPVVREDSSTWRAVVHGGSAVVRYAVRYPTAKGAAGLGNLSFYRPDGALLSGALTYLYVVGETLAPAHVTFDIPPAWTLATGLEPTSDPRAFFAPSYDVLIDCPVMIGAHLHVWPFEVGGVPHRVVYYTPLAVLPIDTVAWVAMHRRIVEQAQRLMGRLPYREYTFLYEDGPGGGLEHLNSATMTSTSQLLAKDPTARAHITAHEFFHAWNVKRIRPIELGPFQYDRPVRTLGLWWAEGVTDFFAEELVRRAALADEAVATRTLAVTIQEYLNNPGHDRLSPERASWTTWDPNTVNHGYSVSYYTTGALLGTMLDLALRHTTDGARGVDDVERYLFDRYAGPVGYTEADLRGAVNSVCGCDLGSFFDRYVHGHETFDFATYLGFAGWKVVVTPSTTDSTGRPLADIRAAIASVNGIGSPGGYVGAPIRLALHIPDGSFAKAGLVDGDTLLAVNGKPIIDQADFSARFANAKVGDRYRVEYVRQGIPHTTTVTILPYEMIHVQIVDLPQITPQQRLVRARWLHGL